MAPEKVVPYFGTLEKPECHILYNVTTMASTWHTVATKDVSLLRRQLDILGSLPKEYIFQNYLRCHDDIGWGLDYDFLKNFSIDEVSHKKFLNDFFTGKYPDTFGRGELYNDDPRLGDARLCGTTASLCGIEKYGFEGNVVGVDRSSHSVFDTTADLRTIDTWDSSILAIVRENAEEKFIGIYNFSDQDKVAWINEDDGIYTDLISGHEMEAKGVMIPAFGCFWLCRKK